MNNEELLEELKKEINSIKDKLNNFNFVEEVEIITERIPTNYVGEPIFLGNSVSGNWTKWTEKHKEEAIKLSQIKNPKFYINHKSKIDLKFPFIHRGWREYVE